ncbi:anhydro-N-acetylmuramic acid kinase [Sphingomonas endolithica]|uniref:anhydro-N-acetylmuramic acid kinase n=1 Tax=Sphingomonas endolithica TaxID=2972485 RepID=UPI0021AF7144|nr:anhydro-N-acetylmuramic acid kinase [Sphingomonas sp. ZFBP2030]
MLVMGYMSGTSLDGVDVAMIETDGERIAAFGPTALIDFSATERKTIEQATRDALVWDGDGAPPTSFRHAEAVIDDVHLRAGRHAIEQTGRHPDLVGFHGQTLLHRPERALSVQVGDPQALADALGIPVVAQLRQDDLRAGGQGAPLVPAYHAALAEHLGLPRPLAFLNVGGVANLTWVGEDDTLVAFDTGPGNGLIDLLVQARSTGRYDDGGRLAAAGKVDHRVLQTLLSHEHFRARGPKSLDRHDFPLEWTRDHSLEDAAATLTVFTAEAIALAATTLPAPPAMWVVCGGGSHNPTMMRALRERLGHCQTADEIGLRGDFVEAEAMAFLAVRSLLGLPLTYPGTTGVPRPSTGGRLFKPASLPDVQPN